jgi:hypothetical protein
MRYKRELIGAVVCFVLCACIFIAFKQTEKQPQAQTTPSVETSLLTQDFRLKALEITYSDSIKDLNSIILRLKKGLPQVNQNWLRESERVKRLSTDDKMLMLQDWLESTQPLQKLIISNDTIIGFTLDHFADVSNMRVDLEYQSLTIDSLQSLCEYYALSQEQYQKLIDNLNLQKANCENRIALKQDQLTTTNATIEQDKKDLKKAKRRSFFNGLGTGIATGAAVLLTLILTL